jgi:hypothetical protein
MPLGGSLKRDLIYLMIISLVISSTSGCASSPSTFHGFKIVNSIKLDIKYSNKKPSIDYKFNKKVLVLPFDDERELESIKYVFDKNFSLLFTEQFINTLQKNKT